MKILGNNKFIKVPTKKNHSSYISVIKLPMKFFTYLKSRPYSVSEDNKCKTSLYHLATMHVHKWMCEKSTFRIRTGCYSHWHVTVQQTRNVLLLLHPLLQIPNHNMNKKKASERERERVGKTTNCVFPWWPKSHARGCHGNSRLVLERELPAAHA